MSIITASELPDSNAGTRFVAQGKLIRLARGLYSDETARTAEEIVRASWLELLGLTFPGAVISDRSGFVGRPADGALYIRHPRTRNLTLPGLTFYAGAGLPAQPSDTPLSHGVYLASEARALIDNTMPSRARGTAKPRTLTRDELQTQVVHLTVTRTAVQRQRLLAEVDEYAVRAGNPTAAEDIRVFFRSAAGDLPTVDSGSPRMRAAQAGRPFDVRRVEQFDKLIEWLLRHTPRVRFQKAGQTFLPFFESYFSNYIEGTEFTIEEAAKIALEGRIPEHRPADAHDILGTYRIVNDLEEMRRAYDDFTDFVETLRRRHDSIMEGRPDKGPGVFKTVNNRAGLTTFVDHTQVEGTLREGYDRLSTLTDPFARATFMMFLVSEVHPFTDGNGRVARIMMNAELIRAGYARIVIPTVLRNEYLSGLTGLTHNGRPDGLVTVLDFAQRYTSQVDFSSLDIATRMLAATNALEDSSTAGESGKRIVLPRSLPLGWEYADGQAADESPSGLLESLIGVASEDEHSETRE